RTGFSVRNGDGLAECRAHVFQFSFISRRKDEMRHFVITRPRENRFLVASVLLLLALLSVPMSAQQPDPTGAMTGDRTAAIDGAGNAFVVPEPTDKADPDYINKK